MNGLSVLIVSVLISAPPAASGLRVTPATSAPSSFRTATNTNAAPTRTSTASAPVRRYTPAGAMPLRTAQLPPKPEQGLPPQPQPLAVSPPPHVAAPQHLDPYEAPHLAPPAGSVPPPPAVEADAGYAAPVIAEPLGMPPGSKLTPAPGPGPFVDPGFAVDCPSCPVCFDDDDDDDCCLCDKIPHPWNMFPHYAYYPQYHGHYYFRPYNYTTLFQQQDWAAAAGIDPRNPYSNKIFCLAMAGFEQVYRPESAPIGSALPVGNGLPQLEDLLNQSTVTVP